MLTGAALIPLLPFDRSHRAVGAEAPAGKPTDDPRSCEYWKYCALDGFLCSCCGGSSHTCPAGTTQGCTAPDGHHLFLWATSMAAPHVSGAIAAFLSIRREFIQKPIRVKEIFMGTATCLGRERYFQGSGLVDLMRAIQSI